jgi:Big-like domain-containing protein
LKYAHVVAAKTYIGCLASGSPPPPPTPPSVSMTAPATAATVSGTITVSANATDAIGMAGVQFKLDGANLGAEDTTPPYSVSLNTTTIANGLHTLTAVARNTSALTTTAVPVTVTVSNAAGGAWPNDPPAFTTVTDQPWNLLTGNGWNWLRRTASKNPDIVSDATAPFSASNMLRMIFTTDMVHDTEPSVHWMGLPGVKEIYTGWWMKLSPNWNCSPAGCAKVTFLITNGAGQVYTGVYHSEQGGGPPYRIAANTEWAPYGQEIWYPNVVTTPVSPGEWHRIEFYYKWETTPGVSGDGIIRWWVDGTLNGDYTNVHYPAGSFIEFQYGPTVQNVPPAEQYMYIDHTYVRRK